MGWNDRLDQQELEKVNKKLKRNKDFEKFKEKVLKALPEDTVQAIYKLVNQGLSEKEIKEYFKFTCEFMNNFDVKPHIEHFKKTVKNEG